MTDRLNDIHLIRTKYAERIADFLIDTINSLGNESSVPDKFGLVVKIERMLSPSFEEFIPVDSSNMAGVSFDKETHILQVDFDSGSRYWYHGVESDKFKTLLEAESKGKFFASEIKPNYPYERVA
jgi:hypothetical protein